MSGDAAGRRPALQPRGRNSEAVYREIVESGPRKLADLMQALLAFLGRDGRCPLCRVRRRCAAR